jgi:hypothetical protein
MMLRLAMLLVVSGCDRPSFGPQLAGFTLGASRASVNISGTCHDTPTSSAESTWVADNPRRADRLSWCILGDTVAIVFSRDTLVSISLRQAVRWRDDEHVRAFLSDLPMTPGPTFVGCGSYRSGEPRRRAPVHLVVSTMTGWAPTQLRWWHAAVALARSDSLVSRFGVRSVPPGGLAGFVAISTETINDRYRCRIKRDAGGAVISTW